MAVKWLREPLLRKSSPAVVDLDDALMRPGTIQAPERRAKFGCVDETDLFRDLGVKEMAELERATAMVSCQRGKVVYTPDSPAETLFIVKRGQVNIYRLTTDGRKLITAAIGPGTIFGEMSLVGVGMRGSFAEAVEESALCVMSRADLEEFIIGHALVGLRLVELLASRLEAAEERLERFAYMMVPARLAATLLDLSGNQGEEIAGVTHQDLAEIVGTHRETATRILNDFRVQKLVELDRLRIRIIDPAGLHALIDS
jgi:CRP-like cAMP-binding protein